MIADEREKARAIATQVKIALVGHDPAAYLTVLFGEPDMPETPTPKPQAQAVEDDFDPNATEGEWKFTQTVDPKEAESILARMLEDTSGTITSTDAPAGEWQ